MRLPVACLLCLCHTAAASESMPALDRWSFAAGTFDNTFHIKGRVDGALDHDGSLIDFGERFGFDRKRVTQLYEFQYLFADRHQVELRHYSDQRTRTANIDETIEFEGQRFPSQVNLRGNAGFSVSEVSYAYWWGVETRTPWAAQAGVIRLRGSLGLRGRIEVDDVGEAEGSASANDHVDAPVVGVAVRHAFNEHWRWFATGRLIYLELGRLSGYAYTARSGSSGCQPDTWESPCNTAKAPGMPSVAGADSTASWK